MTAPVLLTTAHAARLLRLTPRQVRDLAGTGQLSAIRLPGAGHFRVPFAAVAAELARRDLPPDPPPAEVLPVLRGRPACRLCRHDAEHRDAGPCDHCSLWTCLPCRDVHLQGIWPPAVAS